MKYKTGKYTVRVFDTYGTKIKDLDAFNYIDAINKGNALVDSESVYSFVVLRCLHNSQDKYHKAQLTDEEAKEIEDSI